MVEMPASALCIENLRETGSDFVSIGANDLMQYALAVDRNNGTVANRYDEFHPAVMRLLHEVIGTCREHDVATSICRQAVLKPRMIQELVKTGITSISVNVDAISPPSTRPSASNNGSSSSPFEAEPFQQATRVVRAILSTHSPVPGREF